MTQITRVRGMARHSPWYRAKGRNRKLIIQMDLMKKMNAQKEKILIEEATLKGMMTAKALTIGGYNTEIENNEWRITKNDTIEINKTIRKNITVLLEPWLRMKIPLKIIIHTEETDGEYYISGISISKQNSEKLRLFHANNGGTCWGTLKERKWKVNREEVDEAIRRFKELMETINHYSTYTVGDELISTTNYVKLKYRTDKDNNQEVEKIGKHEYDKLMKKKEKMIEEQKALILLNNPYINKETEGEDNGMDIREQ